MSFHVIGRVILALTQLSVACLLVALSAGILNFDNEYQGISIVLMMTFVMMTPLTTFQVKAKALGVFLTGLVMMLLFGIIMIVTQTSAPTVDFLGVTNPIWFLCGHTSAFFALLAMPFMLREAA
jgi:hypothetical protein